MIVTVMLLATLLVVCYNVNILVYFFTAYINCDFFDRLISF